MCRLKHGAVGMALLAVVICGGLSSAMASSVNCFQGNFAADNTVVTQNFNVSVASTYVLQTWSYAGTASGFDPCGNTVSRGGFDPILSLFTGSGTNLITFNDDGSGRVDPSTGRAWDSNITIFLHPGNYTVALTQYDNFAIGPSLAAGFTEDGNPTFTSGFSPGFCVQSMFCDVSGTPGANRTSLYDFSIQPVPEPSSMLLLGSGIVGLARVLRRKINL